MTSLTGCARPVKIDKFFTALLDQIRDMIDENNEEGHHCEIPPNDLLEAEADNDWSYRSM